MKLDLQMPKHDGRIQCKCSIQSCTKTSLEICVDGVRLRARACPEDYGVPYFIHRSAFCPKQRYEEEADDEVGSSTKIQNVFPGSIGTFQLEDKLNNSHLAKGDGKDGTGCEYQLIEL